MNEIVPTIARINLALVDRIEHIKCTNRKKNVKRFSFDVVRLIRVQPFKHDGTRVLVSLCFVL